MRPPRPPRSTDGEKGKTPRSVPRPGTMAHLRFVEEQKRRVKEEQKREVAPPVESADMSPIVDSGSVTNRESLPRARSGEGTSIKAHMIIHGAAVAAGAVGGGLAQVPVATGLVITPIQVSMIVALGSLHGRTLDQSGALSILAAVSGVYVGRTVSQFLIGWIPGLGNAIRAATAAAVTESIGWAANRILSGD